MGVIESTIVELGGIFSQLATMVQKQQENVGEDRMSCMELVRTFYN
jgi:t-SNARE complex subunit (syntaxin)